MTAKDKDETQTETETQTEPEAEAPPETSDTGTDDESFACGRCGKVFASDSELDCTHPRCPLR